MREMVYQINQDQMVAILIEATELGIGTEFLFTSETETQLALKVRPDMIYVPYTWGAWLAVKRERERDIKRRVKRAAKIFTSFQSLKAKCPQHMVLSQYTTLQDVKFQMRQEMKQELHGLPGKCKLVQQAQQLVGKMF